MAHPIPIIVDRHTDSIDPMNHGGVTIIARDGLQLVKIENLGIYTTFEYVCGRVTSHRSNVCMLLIYRQGSKPLTTTFFDEFETVVGGISMFTGAFQITGDTNVRLDRPLEPHSLRYMQILSNLNMRQHVVEKTHSQGAHLTL